MLPVGLGHCRPGRRLIRVSTTKRAVTPNGKANRPNRRPDENGGDEMDEKHDGENQPVALGSELSARLGGAVNRELLHALKDLLFAVKHGAGWSSWHTREERAERAIANAEGRTWDEQPVIPTPEHVHLAEFSAACPACQRDA